MNRITVRGFDDALEGSIRRLADHEGISLNKAALKLLRKGAGLADAEGKTGPIGNDLDRFIGTWTREEADAVNAAIEDFEVIDESAWA